MIDPTVAMTNTAIEWPDDDANEQLYHFNVGLVVEGTTGNRGQYFRIGDDIETPTIIIEVNEPDVIVHEALHATIDFFRSLDMSFDCILNPDSGTTGEEMFCHYHSHFVDHIRDAIKGIQELPA